MTNTREEGCRLSGWLRSVKHGLRGWNWTTRFIYRWLNQLGIYRLAGAVRYWSANA